MLDLTIVIPAKNAQAHLKECLASIPAGFAKRIVVIDSGSTDGTAVLTATSGAELIPFQWDGKFPKKTKLVPQKPPARDPLGPLSGRR